VGRLLAKAPDIYLGEGPFGAHEQLAQRVMEKKRLADAVAELEKLQDGDARRILDGVKRYRDRRLALVESLLATDPARAVDVLEELADEFEDTKLGAAPAKRLEELEGSRDLKDAKRIARRFASYKKRLERCDSCDACRRGEGLRTIRLSCATCRKENERAVESTKKRLAKLIEGKEHLPVAKTVRAYVEALG